MFKYKLFNINKKLLFWHKTVQKHHKNIKDVQKWEHELISVTDNFAAEFSGVISAVCSRMCHVMHWIGPEVETPRPVSGPHYEYVSQMDNCTCCVSPITYITGIQRVSSFAKWGYRYFGWLNIRDDRGLVETSRVG